MAEEANNVGGRPTKFTTERCSAIVDAISHRIPYEYAAQANGISEKTLYNWLTLGQQHQDDEIDSDFSKFLQDVKKAEMQRIREHTDMIAQKPERWQADAWLLERRWYKHFGSQTHLSDLNFKLDRLMVVEGTRHEKNNQE